MSETVDPHGLIEINKRLDSLESRVGILEAELKETENDLDVANQLLDHYRDLCSPGPGHLGIDK